MPELDNVDVNMVITEWAIAECVLYPPKTQISMDYAMEHICTYECSANTDESVRASNCGPAHEILVLGASEQRELIHADLSYIAFASRKHTSTLTYV